MADKKDRMVPSEKAFALLAQLVKHTEPGGIFAFLTEAKAQCDIDAREAFMAEVEGLLMSRANEAGATPPEILVLGARFAFRELRAILAEANKKALPLLAQIIKAGPVHKKVDDPKALLELVVAFSDTMEAFSSAVAQAGAECDEILHMFGVPPDVARTRPTKAEVDKAYDGLGERWCDCAKCRSARAADQLAALKASLEEGGAKSQ